MAHLPGAAGSPDKQGVISGDLSVTQLPCVRPSPLRADFPCNGSAGFLQQLTSQSDWEKLIKFETRSCGLHMECGT